MGFVGARIFAVLYEPAYYLAHPIEIPQVWHGGLAIHGGIIFAAITIWIYCSIKRRSLFTVHPGQVSNPSLRMFDLLVPSLLIGQIIGRFGNYFNQEAYGIPTNLPWGIYIAPENRYTEYAEFSSYHPTFLYEGLWNLLVLFVLLKIEKRIFRTTVNRPQTLKPGSLTALYFIFYGVGRGLLEFIRTDAAWWGPMRVVHWLSIGLIIAGSAWLIGRKKLK